MKIFSRTIEGDPSKPTILLIHGLYSSASNWYTLARKMGYNVKLVDLPNHGHSDWTDDFGYRVMADAIKTEIDTPVIALGHSLGGRVAMILAAECELVTGLIMIDISPVSGSKVDRAFTLFHGMFLQHLLNAKREGVENIEEYLIEKGAAADMTSSVDQAYRQMNVESVAEHIGSLPAEWEAITSTYGKITKPTMLIRGSNSQYITEIYARNYPDRFTNYSIETVEGGSHRLHHEYPDEFIGLVHKFVARNF